MVIMKMMKIMLIGFSQLVLVLENDNCKNRGDDNRLTFFHPEHTPRHNLTSLPAGDSDKKQYSEYGKSFLIAIPLGYFITQRFNTTALTLNKINNIKHL